jgi:HEAT repeat protein
MCTKAMGIGRASVYRASKKVPTLTVLLGSKNVAVRRAAAAVLGDIATPDVVVPLAKVRSTTVTSGWASSPCAVLLNAVGATAAESLGDRNYRLTAR